MNNLDNDDDVVSVKQLILASGSIVLILLLWMFLTSVHVH